MHNYFWSLNSHPFRPECHIALKKNPHLVLHLYLHIIQKMSLSPQFGTQPCLYAVPSIPGFLDKCVSIEYYYFTAMCRT